VHGTKGCVWQEMPLPLPSLLISTSALSLPFLLPVAAVRAWGAQSPPAANTMVPTLPLLLTLSLCGAACDSRGRHTSPSRPPRGTLRPCPEPSPGVSTALRQAASSTPSSPPMASATHTPVPPAVGSTGAAARVPSTSRLWRPRCSRALEGLYDPAPSLNPDSGAPDA